MAVKLCRGCGETKDHAEFYRATKEKDGLQYRCKMCCKVASARWDAANKERRSAMNAAWHRENAARVKAKGAAWYAANKERHAEVMARWNIANKDHREAVDLRWRLANKECVARNSRQWRLANRDRATAKVAAYKAKKKNASPSWANPAYVALFYRLAKEETLRTGRPVHVDHIVPLQSKIVSGLHNEFNLQLLFANENLSKSNRRWPDMP